MVKHGGSRGGTGARPLQGILLVLIILATVVQVMAMNIGEAGEFGRVGETIREHMGTLFNKGLDKIKVPENQGRSFLVANVSRGPPGTPEMSIVIPQVPGGMPVMSMPVMSIDITAWPAALALNCASAAAGAGVRMGGHIMLRRGLTALDLPRATFVAGCAAPAAGGTSSAVLGLAWGGELVPRHVTAFSYTVSKSQLPGPGGDCIDVATTWLLGLPPVPGRFSTPLVRIPMPQAPHISSYNVMVKNIIVADVNIMWQAPLGGSFVAALSTTNPFTYLPRGVYNQLKAELVRRLPFVATPLPPLQDELLCYNKQSIASAADPAVYIVFDGGAVMHLGLNNLFLDDCLSILPATAPTTTIGVLGTVLQNGRTMTIQVAAEGTYQQGTLSFN